MKWIARIMQCVGGWIAAEAFTPKQFWSMMLIMVGALLIHVIDEHWTATESTRTTET